MSSLVHSQPRKLTASSFFTFTLQAAAALTKDRRILPGVMKPAGLLTGRTAFSVEVDQAGKKRRDTQIVQEFRTKLRMAEEMVSKLAFNLREIQGNWNRPSQDEASSFSPAASVTPISTAVGDTAAAVVVKAEFSKD